MDVSALEWWLVLSLLWGKRVLGCTLVYFGKPVFLDRCCILKHMQLASQPLVSVVTLTTLVCLLSYLCICIFSVLHPSIIVSTSMLSRNAQKSCYAYFTYGEKEKGKLFVRIYIYLHIMRCKLFCLYKNKMDYCACLHGLLRMQGTHDWCSRRVTGLVFMIIHLKIEHIGGVFGKTGSWVEM